MHYYQKIFILLSGSFLLFSQGCSDSAPIMPSGIYSTPSVHDSGAVVDTKEITGTFQIVNTTHKVVNIREVKLSCGCADLHLSKEIIPANSFIEARLTVNLEGQYGPKYFDALIYTDNTTVPVIPLRLSANVVTKKLDGTIMFNLGLLSSEEQINQSFTTLPGKVNSISVADIQYSPSFPATPNFDITAVHSFNQDVKLVITGTAPSQQGDFSIELSLIGEGSDWGEARVFLQGIVQPEISIPESVTMGLIESNRSSKNIIKVTGQESFLSRHSIVQMTVINRLPEILSVRFVDSSSPQLELSLQHPGSAGTFSEAIELEFMFSNGKTTRLSTHIAARFL